MKAIICAGCLLTCLFVNAQQDTLKFHGLFNLQGRYQKGNLNQWGGVVLWKGSLANAKWYTAVSASYNYAEVEKFNLVNDFWSNGMVKYQHTRVLYPLAMFYKGFAKSFGIQEAKLGGIGAGINLIQKSPVEYLNVNLIGGYSLFNYTTVPDVRYYVTNIFIASNKELFKGRAAVNWELHAFYIPRPMEKVTGLQNTVRISIPLTKMINFTLTHQYLFNSYVDVHVAKENSMLLVGLMIKK